MKPVIAVIAPGAMGAAIGACLAGRGLKVWTSLAGRSEASVSRARAAGLVDGDETDIAKADIILSVVPPSEALGLARRMSEALRGAGGKPVYVDCNAVNPGTVAQVADVIADTGCPFVDGSIIGGPPRGGYSPTLFLSGPHAGRVAVLGEYGITVNVMDGPVGAASALKMAYAGINKGLIAVGSAMILAAERAGAGEALRAELASSQSQLLAKLGRSIPDMIPKAHRWAPEMEEIAAFAADDPAAAQVFNGFAALYRRLADDHDGSGAEIAMLDDFLNGDEGR